MNYILNDEGDVQVRTSEGIVKYLPKKIAEDAMLMRTYKMEVVMAPLKFTVPNEKQQIAIKIAEDIIKDVIEISREAETVQAKRGRKPNKK